MYVNLLSFIKCQDWYDEFHAEWENLFENLNKLHVKCFNINYVDYKVI